MKTTIEMSDQVYRQVKARAAMEGQTVKAFFLEAVHAKLTSQRRATLGGWRSVFGKANKKDVEDIQRVLDEEFSKIDPDAWK